MALSLRSEQLAAHLRRGGELAPLWVVHGSEALLVLEAADEIRAAARAAGFSERETLVVTQGFKWNALGLAAGNLSLFGGAKLIDLRIPTGKPGRDGGEVLQRYAAAPPAHTLTLITLPGIDGQTRRSSWFKALAASAALVEANAPKRELLPQWLAGRLRAQGHSADTATLALIADQVEGNLLAAHQEILKLGLLHPPGELSLDDVRDAIFDVARYDLDMVREAMLSGAAARCVRLLDGLRGEGAPPPLVLWTLASTVRNLALLRAARDAGEDAAAVFRSEFVFDRERQRALSTAAEAVHAPALRRALLHAAHIDRIIKGLTPGAVWDEFTRLALRIAQRH